MQMHMTSGGSRPNRIALIDVLRGAAILGVIAYHLSWDLRFYQFVMWPIDTHLGWIVFQKSLLTAFIGLAGVSLYLAHAQGVRWRAFWRRFAILAAAAAVTSAATWFMYPDAFVYFGVLHALALFSLMGLPFLKLPGWANLVLGVAIVAVGVAVADPFFNEKLPSVLGFWTVPPLTNDLVPIFPWFGVTLIGIGLMRFATRPAPLAALSRYQGKDAASRALAFCGRWSLVIYLVHQPILLAVIVPLAGAIQPDLRFRASDFLQSCQMNCEIGSGEAPFCQRYCACSLEQVEGENLWPALSVEQPTQEQSREIAAVTQLCSVMAQEPME